MSNVIVQPLQDKPITLYDGGSLTRRFCYVDDLVDGILQSMDTGLTGYVNLGNPAAVPVRALAERLSALTKSASPGIHQPLQGDPSQRSRDMSLAGWSRGSEPAVTLDTGLAHKIPSCNIAMTERGDDCPSRAIATTKEPRTRQ